MTRLKPPRAPLPLPIEALSRAPDRGPVVPAPSILRLPKVLGACLAEEARRRRTTPGALARRVLKAVLADGLVDAVLDDGGKR